MADDFENNKAPNENRLKDIIRHTTPDPGGEFRWPSVDAIVAYVEGNPTEAQRRAVQDALVQSSPFRTALLELAETLEHASTEEAATERERALIHEVSRFLGKLPPRGAPWQRLSGFFKLHRRQVAVVTSAATVLVLFVLPLLRSTGPEYVTLQMDEIAGRQLFFGPSRGSEDDQISIASDARSAAKLAFMSRIRWKDGDEFEFIEPDGEPPIDGATRELSFKLVGEGLTLDVSNQLPIHAEEVRVWILSLPSRQMFQAYLADYDSGAEWGSSSDWGGCVAFTYKHGEGYLHSQAHTFERLPTR